MGRSAADVARVAERSYLELLVGVDGSPDDGVGREHHGSSDGAQHQLVGLLEAGGGGGEQILERAGDGEVEHHRRLVARAGVSGDELAARGEAGTRVVVLHRALLDVKVDFSTHRKLRAQQEQQRVSDQSARKSTRGRIQEGSARQTCLYPTTRLCDTEVKFRSNAVTELTCGDKCSSAISPNKRGSG
eukprot:scaffold676_cov273-Pinguiococcus_pyrenoidosus.AAC.11